MVVPPPSVTVVVFDQPSSSPPSSPPASGSSEPRAHMRSSSSTSSSGSGSSGSGPIGVFGSGAPVPPGGDGLLPGGRQVNAAKAYGKTVGLDGTLLIVKRGRSIGGGGPGQNGQGQGFPPPPPPPPPLVSSGPGGELRGGRVVFYSLSPLL
jgi:hypothetical protein